MNIHALIRNVPLFRPLNEGQLNKVAAGFRTLDVRSGEYLFYKGDSPEELFIIHSGDVELIEHVGDESVCVARLSETNFLGEATMLDGLVHTVSCRATSGASLAGWPRRAIDSFFDDDPAAARKVLAQVARAIAHRLCTSNFAYRGGGTAAYVAGRQRVEHDFLGERPIPAEAYFGVQTLRATENFRITGTPLSQYPNLIKAFAMVKKAAVRANRALRMLEPDIADAISAACDEVIAGALGNQFVDRSDARARAPLHPGYFRQSRALSRVNGQQHWPHHRLEPPYRIRELVSYRQKEAIEKGCAVTELVREEGLLSQEQLEAILKPENMIRPRRS